MNEVAEGVKTAKAVMELAEGYKLAMSISREVYNVLYEGNKVMEAFKSLVRLESGSQHERD